MVKTKETITHKITTSRKNTSLTQQVLIKNAILAEKSRTSLNSTSIGSSPQSKKPQKLLKKLMDGDEILVSRTRSSHSSNKTSKKKSPEKSSSKVEKSPKTPQTKKESNKKQSSKSSRTKKQSIKKQSPKSPQTKKESKKKSSPKSSKTKESNKKQSPKSPQTKKETKKSPAKPRGRPRNQDGSPSSLRKKQRAESSSPTKIPKSPKRKASESPAGPVKKPRSSTSTLLKEIPLKAQEEKVFQTKKVQVKSPKVPRVSGKKSLKANSKVGHKVVLALTPSTSTDMLEDSPVKTSTPKKYSYLSRSVTFADLSEPMVKLNKLEEDLAQNLLHSYSSLDESTRTEEESSVEGENAQLELAPAPQEEPVEEAEPSFYRCALL